MDEDPERVDEDGNGIPDLMENSPGLDGSSPEPEENGFPDVGGWFLDAGPEVFILVFAAVVAGFLLLVVIGSARRRKALLDAGLDPRLLPEEQLAARLAKQQQQREQQGGPRSPSEVASGVAGTAGPQRTLEERLRDLDDLLRREVISAEEHARARAEVLRDV